MRKQMRTPVSLLVCAALLVLFACCASAYSVNRYNNMNEKWQNSDIPVDYYINQNGSSDISDTSVAFSAVRAALQAWEDECRSYMDFTYAGPTSNGSFGTNDGTNLVRWYSSNWPEGSQYVAYARWWYSTVDAHLLDADMAFNEDDYSWSTTGEAGKYDLQGVAAHEAGHWLSLGHSSNSDATMYSTSNTGETKKRSLHQDDRDGVAYLYPNDSNERVWIKTKSSDYGCTPVSKPWWVSPDISLSPEPVVLGSPCTIYVTARNMMPSNQTVRIIVEVHDPDVSLTARSNVLWADTLNNQSIPSGDPGKKQFSFSWTPSANTFGQGHYCMIATVETADLTTDTLKSHGPPHDNNIACDNFHITSGASGGGSEGMGADADNPTSHPVLEVLEVERDELPPGWSASINRPERVFIPLPPYQPLSVWLTVTPAADAGPGEYGIVHLTSTLLSPYTGDTVGTGGITWKVIVGELPRMLKERAVARLEGLKPTGEEKLDKQIDKAIKHINKSLDSRLWEEDGIHIVVKRGKKVFHEERKAARNLMKEMKKKKFPDELRDGFLDVIAMLLDADQMIAQRQIDDAKATGGKEKEIEKAEKEMAKADKDREKSKYDKAIEHYKKAWEHACKAMKKQKKPEDVQVIRSDRRLPMVFSLSQNHPNPVTNSTAIQYALPKDCHVRLDVYNVAGQRISTLVDQEQRAGYQSATFDATQFSNGVYFYRLQAGDFNSTKKAIVLR